MILTHQGHTPQIHATAYVAPTATVCGQVTIGPHCRIMHGAQLVAEGGSIAIGEACIVMENAVIRSTARHLTAIGNFCLVGPQAHLVGCTVEDEVFIATGAAIFHGARLGKGSEVRINGIVHLRTHLPAGAFVPIGWVAVGDPIQILAPDQHDKIWALQQPLNFPLFVYGLERTELTMEKLTRGLADALIDHRDDTAVL
ncbi:MAG: gamma carbonic anhydrase family protein [Chloroflexi bacterium]|nr:gamma carbonic anhydrase family protein [Chloroflexota bacterium]